MWIILDNSIAIIFNLIIGDSENLSDYDFYLTKLNFKFYIKLFFNLVKIRKNISFKKFFYFCYFYKYDLFDD